MLVFAASTLWIAAGFAGTTIAFTTSTFGEADFACSVFGFIEVFAANVRVAADDLAGPYGIASFSDEFKERCKKHICGPATTFE